MERVMTPAQGSDSRWEPLHPSDADIDRRKAIILANSIEEAKGTAETDWITSDNDDPQMWFAREKRSEAIREFVQEVDDGLRVKDVACRREWLRIDYDAIEDAAGDLAADRYIAEEDVPTTIAYTWEGESFTWRVCERTAERARPFWRCEVKTNAA